MPELFKEWAMQLAGLLVFGSFCEVLLPEGNFQKYIRLSLGLLLILSLLGPLRQGVPRWNFEEAPAERHLLAYTERESMEEQQKKDVVQIYTQTLNRKMLLALQEQMGGLATAVTCRVEEEKPNAFGTIKEVSVVLKEEREELTLQAQKILQKDFGVGEEQVRVRGLKEKNG